MLILETHRLQLAEADLNDAEFIFKLLNSPNWIQYIGDRGIKTLDDAKKYIQNSLIKSYTENDFGLYVMKRKDMHETIGLCGLIKRDELEHPDIGFAILPEFENKGYTCEAAAAILKHADEKLKLKTILAITSKENVKSIKVLEKIGLHYTSLTTLPNEDIEILLYSN